MLIGIMRRSLTVWHSLIEINSVSVGRQHESLCLCCFFLSCWDNLSFSQGTLNQYPYYLLTLSHMLLQLCRTTILYYHYHYLWCISYCIFASHRGCIYCAVWILSCIWLDPGMDSGKSHPKQINQCLWQHLKTWMLETKLRVIFNNVNIFVVVSNLMSVS